ncbi:hypothetical protein [Parasitella parasitica]|uniref:Uncharacterized protein n=1 Tax=Parasitella parasitica TaxID=35722 RepID=A0A0B7NR17_9FUNG|nr:hypothetical protein [Parasitella parasitica]
MEIANVKTETNANIPPVKRPRGRPRKIAPAPAVPTTASAEALPLPILAPKRKVEEPETPIPLKRAKKDSVVKKEPNVKKTATVKKERVVKKEPKLKKVSTAKPKVKKASIAVPKVKKEPKAKKTKVVHKLPPEASIYLSDGMRGRVLRAIKQKMFVLSRELSPHDESAENFEVLGSIGNSYTVTIGASITCTCMDYRIKHTHCKHILMVLLKVYRLCVDSPMFQRLTTSRDERMLARSNGRIVDPSVLVPAKIRDKILKLTHEGQEQEEPDTKMERRSLDTSDCPICFEEFDQAKINLIDYCKVCGNNIHQECFNMWKASKGRDVTCVYCRSKWVFPHAQAESSKKSVYSLDSQHRFEGRANFALELGLERKRDISTYKTYKGYAFANEDD